MIRSRAKAPGPGWLGVRDTQGFYGVTQTLVDAPHSQETVLDDNAGAGTAGRGHGWEHLPLVLPRVERLGRLQDSGLVPCKGTGTYKGVQPPIHTLQSPYLSRSP